MKQNKKSSESKQSAEKSQKISDRELLNKHAALLAKYSLASGPSGDEQTVAELLALDFTGIADRIVRTPLGNILCAMQIGKPGKSESPSSDLLSSDVLSGKAPCVLFAAHMDEVSFRVAEITYDGFLRIVETGRWNPLTIAGSPVEVLSDIRGRGGRIPGIVTSVAPHFLKSGNAQGSSDSGGGTPDISFYAVDVGASSAEMVRNEFGIRLGDPIVPFPRFHVDPERGLIFSKALDDRIGVAAMAELGQRLAEGSGVSEGAGGDSSHTKGSGKDETGLTVVFAGTVQEEVGARGAEALVQEGLAELGCRPDLVVVLEGAPADDVPGTGVTPQTRMGGGAHLRLYDPSMIAYSGLVRYCREIAASLEADGITVQETVRRGGGTDGGRLHLAQGGIPSIVMGVPVRYAHTANSMASLFDFEQLIKFLEKFLGGISRRSIDTIVDM